jgi:hypothetical protein
MRQSMRTESQLACLSVCQQPTSLRADHAIVIQSDYQQWPVASYLSVKVKCLKVYECANRPQNCTCTVTFGFIPFVNTRRQRLWRRVFHAAGRVGLANGQPLFTHGLPHPKTMQRRLLEQCRILWFSGKAFSHSFTQPPGNFLISHPYSCIHVFLRGS